jgi:hypothetical protein
MQKASFVKRFVIPVSIVLLTMAATSAIYSYSWRINNDTLQWIIANISAVLLFVSIGFGALVIYPMAFFRGASTAERIIASLVTPLAWDIKEIVRVSEFFTYSEALYYGLNQVFLLSIFGAFAQMGLCELICRWRLGRRGEAPARVFSAIPVISILLGLGAFYVILIWGVGVHFFYIYIEGYKALFH